jgi:hypothetical protein
MRADPPFATQVPSAKLTTGLKVDNSSITRTSFPQRQSSKRYGDPPLLTTMLTDLAMVNDFVTALHIRRLAATSTDPTIGSILLEELNDVPYPWALAEAKSEPCEKAPTDTDSRNSSTRNSTSEVSAAEDLIGDGEAALDST